MLTCLSLALSLSIDALGIGISYGARKIKIVAISIIIMSIENFLVMKVFVNLGKYFIFLLPQKICEGIAILFLLLFGTFLIAQGFINSKRLSGIQNPSTLDKDKSKTLDPGEAIVLGLVLSIDSIGVAISSAASGINVDRLPIFCCLLQIVFLILGGLLGEKITNTIKIKESLWSSFSGGILILIALSRLT